MSLSILSLFRSSAPPVDVPSLSQYQMYRKKYLESCSLAKMHYPLSVLVLWITGAISSPLQPRQGVVTVNEWFTDTVTVTRYWNHHHWPGHVGLSSTKSVTNSPNSSQFISGSTTSALPVVTSTDTSTKTPSESPVGSSAPATTKAQLRPTISAVVSPSLRGYDCFQRNFFESDHYAIIS